MFITQVIKRPQCQRSTSQVKAEDRVERDAGKQNRVREGGVITGAGDVGVKIKNLRISAADVGI